MKQIYGAGGGGGGSRSTKVEQPPKPVIAQDDAALKSISFAKLQFLLCEGDIEGPAFGGDRNGLERSVYLDNTPIRVGNKKPSPQPEDLVFSYGRPADQQSSVPDYNQTSNTIGVDVRCDNDSPVAQTVTEQEPGKTHYANVLLTFIALQLTVVDGEDVKGNTGDVRTYKVEYIVSYVDALGVTRTPVRRNVKGEGRVEGKFGSTFQRSHEFLLEGVAPWTIRVERKTRDDDTFDPAKEVVRSAFNFSSITVSYDDNLRYPDSSILTVGVRADIYDQIPNLSVDLKGLKVEIPTNATVNPDDGSITYAPGSTWNGTFKTAWTSDPAWCLRDLILNPRYGTGEFINESFVDKWSLYQISEYCNELVPSDRKNPNGSTIMEPRFSCNLLLQSSGEAWTVLQQFSSIFRGMVYYASSIAVAAQDREKEAIFTFNESNTIEQYDDSGQVGLGNFSYSGSARRARHTVCLVSYDDPTNNYEPRIEALADQEALAEYGYRSIDLRLLGVTSRSQALRAAEWTLLSEQLLTDTVAFRCNEIGMALRPGDIIKIADPTKAAVRAGGRITGVQGNLISLDYLPVDPPGGLIGSTLSWMYNLPDAGLDGANQPRLQSSTVLGRFQPSTEDWENGFAACIDRPDPDAPYANSDAGTYVGGEWVSICFDVNDPIFDAGTALYDNADIQPRDEINSGKSNIIIIDGDGGHPPEVGNVFLLEFPSRSAQEFRVLTVTEEEEGIYAITGLRYRSDIYDKVDFDTPLDESKDYFYTPLNPDPPSELVAQVIWDNGQAKISVRWNPPDNSTILFQFNLEVRYYRVQWQSGTFEDGLITWSEAWNELPPQSDDQEMIPIEQLTISDKFRVRISTVSRLGIQSEWSEYVTAEDITNWFPMPDISTGTILTFSNQSSGGQLLTWNFGGLAVPPYVSGVQVDVSPNRELTPREKDGLRPPIAGTDTPPAHGTYIYGDYPLEEYAVTIFHADTNWNCRIHFLTFVQGLEGSTFASVTVTRNDLVPPAPDLFTVVTDSDKESIAPMRRFSWSLPTSEISDNNASTLLRAVDDQLSVQSITPNWPLGKVTDIVQFLVRYKAGFNNTWDQGVSLFADGVPGDQRYFETELFDGGNWTVMIRSVDRTGWVSDDQAAIVVNLGDAIPTNVVETFDAKADGWPGQKTNCTVNSDGDLEQINPAADAEYLYPFEVTADDAGILIITSATNTDPNKNGTTPPGSTDQGGTYQWFLREIGSDEEDPMYPDPQGDPMYPPPQSDYMYLNTNTTIGISFHPYVPFEKLSAGNYEIGCRIRSIDGAAKTILTATEVQMDYPDVERTGDDITVSGTNSDRVTFAKPFPHAVKAVSVTLQDPPGSVTLPATAYIRGKDVDGFNIRLLKADGSTVGGLIDYQAVGY